MISLSPEAIEVYEGAAVYVQRCRVADLHAAPYNPRAMTDDERRGLERSLSRWGLVDLPIFNLRTQELVGGHQRVAWLRGRGVELVACVVLDIDPAEHKALLVTLNDRRSQGHYVGESLATLLGSLEVDAPSVFKETGLGGLLKSIDVAGHSRTKVNVDPPSSGDDGEDPAALEPPAVPRSREGDLWLLGDHRLYCGDSEVVADVDAAIGGQQVACVITDPPYAIYGSSTGVESDVADDRMVRAFFEKVWGQAHRVLPWEGHAYLFCDWRSYPAASEGARRSKMAPRNLLVWDKSSGLGSNYANTYELIAYHAKIAPKTFMKKKAKDGSEVAHRPILKPNLIKLGRPVGDERPHNASKPVDLVAELIQNSTNEGEVVLDMFGGGGSTLIACEKTGRRAVLIEVSPGWCDVIASRWERVTGRTAVLVPRDAQPAGGELAPP